jgi:hypothetical protein
LQTARRPKDFAQNNRVPQTGCRSEHRRDVDSCVRRFGDRLGRYRIRFCRRCLYYRNGLRRRRAFANYFARQIRRARLQRGQRRFHRAHVWDHNRPLIGWSRRDRRGRLGCGRLPKRLQEFSDSLFVCFVRLARKRARHLRWRRRSPRRIARALATFSRSSGQDLKENRQRDEQKEKEIIEMHRCHFLLSQLPSVRGLSVPAMDSRIVVSACTFFIR